MMRGNVVNATYMTAAGQKIEWDGPARGRVGMFGLIAAESAIFTIFAVAYLFYVGKSLTGPTPKDVLSVPIFYTICLLSSSFAIHMAVRALRRAASKISEPGGSRPSRWVPPSYMVRPRSGTGRFTTTA